MDRILKMMVGATILAALVMVIASAASPAPKMILDKPVIKKLSTYRGTHFPGFAEFRAQEVEYDEPFGDIMLVGEPYDVLLNVTYITSAYRYEDAKKNDYATILYVSYSEPAILIRQPYKDVVSSIRRAMEAQVK